MSILEAIRASFTDPMIIWGKFAATLPNLIAALFLLIVGHFLAKLLGQITARLLKKLNLDKLSESTGLGNVSEKTGFDATPSTILGKIVYWLVFLTFLISAADTLGLERVSSTIDNFVLYLPKVVGAFLVGIIGLFVAGLIRTAVETSLSSMNLGYEKVIGGIIYTIIVIVVVSLAIGQLEIETALLNQVVTIFLFAGAGAVALAMGLGTRDVAGSVVAGVYVREMFQPGHLIKIDDLEGVVIEVGSTSLLLETGEQKQVTIPNRQILDARVEILNSEN